MAIFKWLLGFLQSLGLLRAWEFVPRVLTTFPPIVIAFVGFLSTALLIRILMKLL